MRARHRRQRSDPDLRTLLGAAWSWTRFGLARLELDDGIVIELVARDGMRAIRRRVARSLAVEQHRLGFARVVLVDHDADVRIVGDLDRRRRRDGELAMLGD